MERRLDYIFISNCLQEFDLSNDESDKNGNGFSKFNSSLAYDASMLRRWKKIITKINNSKEFIENAQTKWKFSKYEIKQFTTDYSKAVAKKGNNRGLI